MPSEIVQELISVNFQVSECYCEVLYRQAVHTGFSLDVAENTPTFQCKAAVSSVRKLLRVHSKFENAVNNMAKYIENIPDTLCIQLSTSDIKRVGFVRFTNNCQ